ncbi:MAG: hypothetical protein ACP5HM_09865 [Anaerolineae bacterium]
MLLPYSIINPLTLIEVERRLPHAGEVLVNENTTVEPYQIVAEATRLPDFTIINVSRKLGLSPKRVRKALQVDVGDQVEENEVLASRGGLGGRVCRAPFSGIITGYGRGRLLLEANPVVYRMPALVPGTVARIWPGEGVTIHTHGALIQGTWGNQKETYGVLRMAVRAPHHPLRARRLDASVQGAIVVGGVSLDEEALEQAIEMQVRGILVGGVPVELLGRLEEVEIPVLATEGIGEIPMSAPAFELLRSLDGREGAVCARVAHRRAEPRPYIAIPMPAQSSTRVTLQVPLKVGDQVRILRNPYLGMTGTVTELPSVPSRVETGARFRGAHVDLGEETVFIPLVNLERVL